MLIFGNTDKKLELEGDLLKMFTNESYKVDLANLPDEKLMFELAKKKYFDERARGKKKFQG